MHREDFGKLVRHLRGEIGLTRRELTEEVNQYTPGQLGGTVIRDIELGRRRITHEELSGIASALRLTSRERKEFFFASMNLDADDIQPTTYSQDEILNSVLDDLEGLRSPFLLLDKYHYILAANTTASTLFLQSQTQLTQMFDSTILRYNLLAILFSNTYQELMKIFQMESYERSATRSLQVFRAATLLYRFNPNYLILAEQLRKFPLFRVYWEQAISDEGDEFRNQRSYLLIHPTYGPLNLLIVLSITSTPYGDLFLANYLPANSQTEEIFKQMADETTFRIMRMSNWRE